MKTINLKISLKVLLIAALFVAVCSHAEEGKNQTLTPVSQTTLGGYIDTSATWQFGPGVQAVPEPSTLALLAMGSVGVGFICRRRNG
jgi:hypothetical protein